MNSVPVDRVQISYKDSGGTGRPVLLIHGFPFSSAQWDPQFAALGAHYRLLAPDLMGFGASDVLEDRTAYSMDAYAEQCSAVLEHLGIGRAVVCGLSMGGYVSFALWRKSPELFAGLVLANTRAVPDSPEGARNRTAQQERVLAEGIEGVAADMLAGPLLAEGTRNPGVVARVRAIMNHTAAGYVGALEAMKNRPDSTADLAGIVVPALVIAGELDNLVPPDESRAMRDAIPDARLVHVAGAGHVSNLENPREFNTALEDFLSALGDA